MHYCYKAPIMANNGIILTSISTWFGKALRTLNFGYQFSYLQEIAYFMQIITFVSYCSPSSHTLRVNCHSVYIYIYLSLLSLPDKTHTLEAIIV